MPKEPTYDAAEFQPLPPSWVVKFYMDGVDAYHAGEPRSKVRQVCRYFKLGWDDARKLARRREEIARANRNRPPSYPG